MISLRRGHMWSVLMSLSILIILVSLGTWQVKRLTWKTSMLSYIQAQMAAPAVPMPESIAAPEDWEYHRVTIAGQFLYSHEFKITPRTQDGRVGFHLVTLFQRASGGYVFINRGWAADDVADKIKRPQGIVRVEGIIQVPKKSYFTPDNVPAKNEWYWPDIQAMMAASGIPSALPVIMTVSTKEQGVYPMAGQLRLDIPNDHRQYAIFWFGMAGVFLLISLVYHFRK